MNNAMMKKWFALLLALLTLCLPLTACQEKEPKLAVQAQQEKQAEAKDATGKLRVVTDLDPIACNYHGSQSQARKGQEAFQKILEHFGGTPSGMEVELEVLPMEESDYQMALTRMRTEIMAGSGPDVYYLSCFDGYNDVYFDSLFPNPEHAMASGFFLPLDDYMANARFMELEQLEPTLMETGRYEDTQYILPMFYRLAMGILYRDVEPDALPSGWDEAAASGEEDVRSLYAQAVYYDQPGFRQMAFSRIADNVGEELLLDKDTLFRRTKDALTLIQTTDRSPDSETNTSSWDMNFSAYIKSAGKNTKEWGTGEGLKTFFAPRGGDGDVTASMQNWCAVNSNTEHPEDAFFIADVFMSEEFLSARNFWNPKEANPGISLLGEMAPGCIPVHKELLSSNKKGFHGNKLPAGQCDALNGARENISCAYISSNVDRELNRMFDELWAQVKNGGSLSDDELRRKTDQCWMTLKMMLAES